jgi:hypothetical protein
LQKFLSAHDLLLIALAIETSETYCFLNSAMDSSVIRNILGAGLGLSHPNATNRRMDLVLHSSWRAVSARVLVSPARTRPFVVCQVLEFLIRHEQPCNRSVDAANDGQLSRQHGSHDVCLDLDRTIPAARNDCEPDVNLFSSDGAPFSPHGVFSFILWGLHFHLIGHHFHFKRSPTAPAHDPATSLTAPTCTAAAHAAVATAVTRHDAAAEAAARGISQVHNARQRIGRMNRTGTRTSDLRLQA